MLPLRKLFRRYALFGLRPGHRVTAADGFLAHRFEPVAQPERRDAIVFVIALDRLTDFGRQRIRPAKLERQLHRAQAAPGIGQWYLACEAVAGLEVLDGVPLNAGPDALPDYGI